MIVCWVLGFALLGQRLYGYLPGSGNAMALTVTDHNRRSQVVFDQIPPDASVSAQDRLNPHVAGRKTVYIYPRVDDADYVLLDVTGSAWPQHPNDLKQSVDELRQQGFGIAAADDGYLLLGRNTPSQAIGPEFYTAWQDSPAGADAIPSGAEFGGVLRLDDYKVRNDRNGELVVDLHWTALEPIAEDLRFYVGYFASKGQALHDNIYYQPMSVLWYPTSMWPQGQRTFVQTLPWNLDADQFTLGVGVYAGEEGWTGGGAPPSYGCGRYAGAGGRYAAAPGGLCADAGRAVAAANGHPGHLCSTACPADRCPVWRRHRLVGIQRTADGAGRQVRAAALAVDAHGGSAT